MKVFARAILAASIPLAADAQELPSYAPLQQVTGTIHTWGSPQMGELLKLYEESFRRVQPGVRFDDDLKSTLSAVAGVYSGRADIGLLGREIWPTEVAAFTATAGHAPKVIEVATGSFDVPKATFALMVFVPKDNPVASLSMAQLARIFSTRDTVKTWGELGLKGAWAGRPIHRYGFAIDNDKSQIFAQLVFAKGAHWSGDLREFANGSDGTDAGELILRALANDPDGIALSNVHYATSAVRALPLSTAAHPQPIAPTRDNVASTLYPLTRAVYMVLDDAPSAATVEFMRFVLSRDGAQAVEREGEYLPLTKGNAASQMERLAAR